jgi:hypothetical protein
MKDRFAKYEELDDLPSLVNSLTAMGRLSPITGVECVIVINAATAIEGLAKERDALQRDLAREREARRVVDEALRRALATIKAQNESEF